MPSEKLWAKGAWFRHNDRAAGRSASHLTKVPEAGCWKARLLSAQLSEACQVQARLAAVRSCKSFPKASFRMHLVYRSLYTIPRAPRDAARLGVRRR